MKHVVKVMVATLVLAGCAANPRIVHDKTGATSKLEDLKGRAVVLTFWVDYCEPCMAQMPVVFKSVAEHGDRIVLLPVYSREKPGHRLDGWLGTQPEWFRDQVCWANNDFLVNYDRTRIPKTYVYGRNGRLVETFEGTINAERAPIFQASLLRALAAVK